MNGLTQPSYRAGFYSPIRGGRARHPQLWRDCTAAWCPSLGSTGAVLYGQSQFRHDGILTNFNPTTAWEISQGKFALKLDGVDDFVLSTTAYNAAILGNDFHTVSLWFNGSFANAPVLISAGTGANDFFLEVGIDSSLYWGYSNTFRTYTATTPAGMWNHIAMVKTGPGDNGNLFLNGILQTNYTGTLTTAQTTPQDLLVGKYFSGFPFNGLLDDIRIYKRPMGSYGIHKLALRRGIAYELARRPAARVAAAGTNKANMLVGAWL